MLCTWCLYRERGPVWCMMGVSHFPCRSWRAACLCFCFVSWHMYVLTWCLSNYEQHKRLVGMMANVFPLRLRVYEPHSCFGQNLVLSFRKLPCWQNLLLYQLFQFISVRNFDAAVFSQVNGVCHKTIYFIHRATVFTIYISFGGLQKASRVQPLPMTPKW